MILFLAIIFGVFWKFNYTLDVIGEFDSGFELPELVNVKMIKLVLVDAFVIAITGYFTTLAVEQRISENVKQDPVNVAEGVRIMDQCSIDGWCWCGRR